ncbi:MAG TPA: sulfate ABC transporter permease subunit CysT [Micromonosporaceae bacterium]|jgi:sulfate transport system permease protein|nr:sulfate ABC transporter permease subunit CysT [Micromonosporaceae bacterium]
MISTDSTRVREQPATTPLPRRSPRRGGGSGASRPRVGAALSLGTAVLYLSLIVTIPLGAVVFDGTRQGPHDFWTAVTTPDAWAALKLTVVGALLVAVVNLFMGTVIAWVLVRDRFPGMAVVDLLIDLPFALPTIVAGLVLLALYGTTSPLHIDVAFTRTAVILALLFVTLPFVVRTVQPVLLELDRDMEQAAYSLGASPWTTFRRIVLANLAPAMLSGAGLAFTRAIAEYGSTSLISGNLPGKTQVAAVVIFGRIQNDDNASAAAISTVLLAIALLVLVALDILQRRTARRE